MTTQEIATPARRRPPRTLRDVERADPTTLAMMTRAQVDALPRAARTLRVERMLAANDTLWTQQEIAAYLGRPISTVKTWRWRTGREQYGDSTALPEPLPERRRGGRGQPRPQWPMPEILLWTRELERCDRIDLVPFPDGRKRPGRTRDAVKAARERIAPEQRTGRPAGASAVAA